MAVATPPGLGGVAIVRLSGPGAEAVLGETVRRSGPGGPWQSHHLYHGRATDAEGEPLDEVLAVLMRGPRSYTGEDVGEIHCHGGLVVPARVVEACVARGARQARPGEFTLRAFLAGRVDLAQAEAVAGLVEAATATQARLALEGLGGALSRRVGALRERCLDWLAAWEAEMDFCDEVPELGEGEVRRRLAEVAAELDEVLALGRAARHQAEGALVVVAGPPNAGKSTLWNALLGEERALVTPYPGTTRDRLEHPVLLQGTFVRLVDTAGLRAGGDPVERLGMERTRESARSAEVLVVVLDGSSRELEGVEDLEAAARAVPGVVVLNKEDLPAGLDPAEVARRFPAAELVRTSLLDPRGGEPVRRALVRALAEPGRARAAGALSVNARQGQALARAREALARLELGLSAGVPPDCLALELRDAVRALGEVTGQDVGEDLLDRVFASFCLGK